jgi:hypothetical protein
MTKPLAGHTFSGLKGDGKHSPKNTYASKMKPNHPTLKPQTNYQERPKASNTAAVPPELNLP